MEYLIYDAIILAVLILFAWLGWRKGLLLSLCGLAVAVLAFFGAGFLADTLDTPIVEAITPKLETVLVDELVERFGDLGLDAAVDALREEGGLLSWQADAAEELLASAGQMESVRQLFSQAAEVLATTIVYRLLFALSFVLLFILLTLLLRALDVVAKLPGLHFFNGLGGGLLGLCKGAVILFVAVFCLQIFSKLITPEAVENTYLLKFFVRFDPISLFFKT